MGSGSSLMQFRLQPCPTPASSFNGLERFSAPRGRERGRQSIVAYVFMCMNMFLHLLKEFIGLVSICLYDPNMIG